MPHLSQLTVVLGISLLSTAAFGQFDACGEGGPCDEAQKTPGCSDSICCEQVCALDAFCCEIIWDESCVLLANDTCNFECSGAPELSYGDNAFDTTASTAVLDLAGYCDPGPFGDDSLYNTIYYRFTPNEDALHTFSTCNQASYDTRLAILANCDPASVISCLDDTPGCAGYSTTLATELLAGVEVIVAVGGYAVADLGTGTLTIDTAAPDLVAYRQDRVEDGGDGAWYGAYRMPGGLSWESLRDLAMEVGDDFMVVHSAETNALGQILFQSSGAGNGMAIGLFQDLKSPEYSEPAGGWIWVDGSAVDYTNWYDGEPNDGGGTEHYAELWGGGTWNDRGNNNVWNGYFVRFASGTTFDPSVNDACDGAIEIFEGENTLSTTNNYGMETLSTECTENDSNVMHNTGWYSFTAPTAGNWSFKTCGTGWDTRLAAFDGCSGTLLNCNDDDCGLQSRIIIEMEAGAMATILLGGFSTSDAGPATVTVELLELPVTTEALSINFRGGAIQDGSDGGTCYETTFIPAGAPNYGTLYWQNLRGPNTAAAADWFSQGGGDDPTNLLDGNGLASGASLDFAVAATWRVISYPANDTELMRRGYLDSGGLSITATIANVPYDAYDVIAYFDADGSDRPGWVSANGAEPRYFLTEAATAAGYTFPPLVEAIATIQEDAIRSHYAIFSSQTGSTCTIELNQLAGNIGFNGLQIIEAEGGEPCNGDFNGDGEVNGADFGLLLAAWGACPDCMEDINGDGQVNGADVGLELANWGTCQ